MRTMTPEELKTSFVTFYGALFAGATSVQLAPIAKARHFAMLDQPSAFDAVLESFVNGK